MELLLDDVEDATDADDLVYSLLSLSISLLVITSLSSLLLSAG
jgi:hypothetical protein